MPTVETTFLIGTVFEDKSTIISRYSKLSNFCDSDYQIGQNPLMSNMHVCNAESTDPYANCYCYDTNGYALTNNCDWLPHAIEGAGINCIDHVGSQIATCTSNGDSDSDSDSLICTIHTTSSVESGSDTTPSFDSASDSVFDSSFDSASDSVFNSAPEELLEATFSGAHAYGENNGTIYLEVWENSDSGLGLVNTETSLGSVSVARPEAGSATSNQFSISNVTVTTDKSFYVELTTSEERMWSNGPAEEGITISCPPTFPDARAVTDSTLASCGLEMTNLLDGSSTRYSFVLRPLDGMDYSTTPTIDFGGLTLSD
jgi:hypothetical protein